MMRDFAVWMLLLSILSSVPTTLQLEATVPDGATFHACVGDDLTLDWNVNLEANETMQESYWYYQAAGQTREMIAMLSGGSFLTMPSYSQRLHYIPEAGLLLNHVTVSDTGNYTVAVSAYNSTNDVLTLHRTAILEMSEEPAVVKFQLELRQKSDLVYDVKTRQWHVVLQCGHFAFLGNPPVTGTEWTTPSGTTLSSSGSDSGYFSLLVPNPVKGGNYTCRIPSGSPAASCLPSNNTLLQEASMFVDGLEARLRVIEAQQTTLQTENNRLREELEQQKNDTDARVTEVETANALLKDDNANLTELVLSLENQTASLQYQLDSLFQNMSEPRVSFHVLLDHDTVLNNHETLVPKVLLNNIGQGYNTTTGAFRAPLPGAYFLLVSTASPSSLQAARLQLMAGNSENVVCSVHTASGAYNSGSCQAVVHLDEGDLVWLRSSGEGHFARALTGYSGFLISAD